MSGEPPSKTWAGTTSSSGDMSTGRHWQWETLAMGDMGNERLDKWELRIEPAENNGWQSPPKSPYSAKLPRGLKGALSDSKKTLTADISKKSLRSADTKVKPLRGLTSSTFAGGGALTS